MSKPINIAIDSVFFQMSYSGITRVWETLLNNFKSNSTIINFTDSNNSTENTNDSTENTNDYQLIILHRTKKPDNIYKFKPELKIEKKFKVIKINEFNYMTMNQDVDYLNYICKTEKIDIFISTYYTYCTVVPNIMLIHDMIPEVFKLPPNHMWEQKNKAILNASSFITISKTTHDDLIKFYPHIKNDSYPIDIIYNSVKQNDMNDLNALNSMNTMNTMNRLNKFNTLKYDDSFLNTNNIKPKSYVFAMATNNEEYKNLSLIKLLNNKYGFELSRLLCTPSTSSTSLNNPIPIILICKENIPNGFKKDGNILYLSHVSDAMLNSFYKNALCFICPSLYEGFGLPIFEAFSHSTPVIALKTPIFQELGGGGIHFCDNNEKSVFERILEIHKNEGKYVSSRIEFGLNQLKKFTEEIQMAKWHSYFSNLKTNILKPKPFINIIIQTYKESNPERLKELEYCIKKNLENPYVQRIHDFGNGFDFYNNLEHELKEKYIFANNPTNKWLTFEMAIKYTSLYSRINNTAFDKSRAKNDNTAFDKSRAKNDNTAFDKSRAKNDNTAFENNSNTSYWCIMNLDIFLDSNSNWALTKGKLNEGYIFAQSRHEFSLDELQQGKEPKMDINFARMMHSHTQDAWLFKTPINININNNIYPDSDFDFELGFLGCDNAIADRFVKCGYKVINQPETYKIFHYDVSKGKTSTNYMEKHKNETKQLEVQNMKPKNKYPERVGSYLVPNFDQMLGNGQDIDFISIINGLGGCSNLERYEFISKLFSSRIVISNP